MKQLKPIFILSFLGAREWIRLKFFHLVIFIAILFIGFSLLLSSLTFAVQERLLFDFGLSGLEMGLIFISCLIGTHTIQREIDRKTLFVLLARPIPRWHIVIGAWGSLFILNLIFLIGFSASLGISLFLSPNVTTRFSLLLTGFLVSAASSFIKSIVISSVAIALGLMARPILAFGAAISYWILCYSIPDIRYFVTKLDDKNLVQVVDFVDKIIPQFYKFNWKSYYNVIHIPETSEVLWVLSHSLGWTCLWLFLAALFFKRKEIV